MTAVEQVEANGVEAPADSRTTGFQRLREPFPPEQVGKLPKPTKRDAVKGKCKPKHEGGAAPDWQDYYCGGFHGLPAVHLDYVGHAAVTSRLVEVDPCWTWNPIGGWDDNGEPKFVRSNGSPIRLWINLTVLGVTRPGVGTVTSGAFDAEKQLIGDALRNAARMFGVAVDLWIKGSEEEHGVKVESEPSGPRIWAGIDEARAKEMGWASLDEAGQEHATYIEDVQELPNTQREKLKARKEELGISWPMSRTELETMVNVMLELEVADAKQHDTTSEESSQGAAKPSQTVERFERLTPRLKAQAVREANQAGLAAPSEAMDAHDVQVWTALLDKLEESTKPSTEDDETLSRVGQ